MPEAFDIAALIHSPPQELYAIIADYHHGHPQILPKPPFVSLAVDHGGFVSRLLRPVYGRELAQLAAAAATRAG